MDPKTNPTFTLVPGKILKRSKALKSWELEPFKMLYDVK